MSKDKGKDKRGASRRTRKTPRQLARRETGDEWERFQRLSRAKQLEVVRSNRPIARNPERWRLIGHKHLYRILSSRYFD